MGTDGKEVEEVRIDKSIQRVILDDEMTNETQNQTNTVVTLFLYPDDYERVRRVAEASRHPLTGETATVGRVVRALVTRALAEKWLPEVYRVVAGQERKAVTVRFPTREYERLSRAAKLVDLPRGKLAVMYTMQGLREAVTSAAGKRQGGKRASRTNSPQNN